MLRFLIFFTIFTTLRPGAESARILGVFPFPSHSHQVVFRALTTELSKRGHQLTVFTTDPLNDPTLVNLTEVDLHFLYDGYLKKVNFIEKKNTGLWSFLNDVYEYGEVMSDETFSHPKMQKLLQSKHSQQFDLILVQSVYLDSLYALSIVFNAPLIGISSLPLLAPHYYIFGNPLMPAYAPDSLLGLSDDMNFWQRIRNFYYYVRQIYEYLYISMPIQDRVVKKHFGHSMPPTHQLASVMSMLFVNSHPFHTYPRPLVPAIVQIGGFRLNCGNKSLSEDIKKVLDNSKQGFIYFSLGSNIKSSSLSQKTREVFLSVFAELPYTVIWKFESSDLLGKPENVIIRKWLPQEQILAHPNALLFIYQGGLQSTEEAIYAGVPVIGFPIFSDQIFNLNKLAGLGIGKIFDIETIEKDSLKNSIIEIASNSSYKNNMLQLQSLLKDTQNHPMDQAIWWAEHVIRHKGAYHLRNKSRDLPWYKTQLLDIFIVFVVFLALIAYTVYIILRLLDKACTQHLHHLQGTSRSNKKNL